MKSKKITKEITFNFSNFSFTVPNQQGHMMPQMPMNAPPHHLQQNGPSHLGSAPNHLQHHPPIGPHGELITQIKSNIVIVKFNKFLFRIHYRTTTQWNANATNASNGLSTTSNAAKCKSISLFYKPSASLFFAIIMSHKRFVAPQINFGSFKSIGEPSGLQQ